MPKSVRRLSSAKQDYLKAILHLTQDRPRVSTTEVAQHLGVRPPSATAMVQRLAAEKHVHYSPRQGVRLTPTGRIRAVQVLRRHRLLETFLVDVLGLDWSEVHAEAEVLEHHLSDRMVDAIDRCLDHPKEDPHGHPIPDANAAYPKRELTALRDLAKGERGTVREVHGEAAERLHRWKELGLVPGARLKMNDRQELEDVMHIQIGDKTTVTGSEGVQGVLVEVER